MSEIAARKTGRIAALAGIFPLIVAGCSSPGGGALPPAKAMAAIVAPAPQRPVFETAQIASLKTLSADALVARLGEPDFTRRDPPAEIWQYRGISCVLDVFLYPQDGEMRVLHAATRDRERLKAPENACTPFEGQRAADAGS